MSDVTSPSITTIKTLFALSCNRCAYPRCEEPLTDPSWGQVNADIAHIRGDRPGSARYDATMSDDERQAYDNLLLLCPNCHRRVDRLDPDGHSVQRMIEIKALAESTCRGVQWTDDGNLERFARLVIDSTFEVDMSAVTVARPQLVVRKGADRRVEVRNVGDGDAFEIVLEGLDDKSQESMAGFQPAPTRLSPGGTWRAAFHAATFGNAGPHVVRVRWTGANGTAYDGEFPLS